jgi:hypothetical protein
MPAHTTDPGSGQVGFVVDKVVPGQVFSEYFGFPWQSLFHRIILHPHNHPGQAQEDSKWPRCRVDPVWTPPPTTLFIAPWHEDVWVSRGKAPWNFNLHSRSRWVVSVTVRLFCLRKKILGTTGQEAGWVPERVFTRHWKRNHCFSQESNSILRSSSPYSGPYSDSHFGFHCLSCYSSDGFVPFLFCLFFSTLPHFKISDFTCWGLPPQFLYFTPLPVPPTQFRTFPQSHQPWKCNLSEK